MTSRRPIAIALAASAFYAGIFVTTANAQMHYVRVTLVTGQQLTITLDIPPGTPLEQLQIPGLPAPIASIVDLGSTDSTPTPTATASPTVQPTATASPTPSATPKPDSKTGKAPTKKAEKPNQATGKTEAKGGDKPKREANTQSLTGKVATPTPTPTPTPVPDSEVAPPSQGDPSFSLAEPGAAKAGVPNFFIDKFKIPPFLLPIYQAAGTEYGIRWEVLAAINEIETNYGRNLNVSSAGAEGWMQFMPATWKAYGVDGNKDGLADPYSPVDAIFSAARYLKAAGADRDLRAAVWAYNHADWYVDSVLMRAQVIGGMPTSLVSSLTGLTEGRFPVAAKATYADEITNRKIKAASRKRNKALPIEANANRNGVSIYADAGAPVIAVSDAKVTKIGVSKRLGRYITIQDAYGNSYTYGRLAKVSRLYAAPKPQKVDPAELKRMLAKAPKDKKPTRPASNTERPAPKTTTTKPTPDAQVSAAPAVAAPVKQRLFANPTREQAAAAGGAEQEFLRTGRIDGALTPARAIGLARDQIVIKKLRKGSQVPAGTVLGRIGTVSSKKHPHVRFEIRPAGRGAPRIDPKPILDGWKLLESTAIYRAQGENPFSADSAASIGQILLMDKQTLVQRVLSNPRIQVYGCGRQDIQAGQIDRRVLATLEFLVANGFNPTISSLQCGHTYLTSSGNVSEHSTGTAVDIAAINGKRISPATQGKGSITEQVIQALLTLQGNMKPHQIISLMQFEGADNTLAMGDHDDHIHVGFKPQYGVNAKASEELAAILNPSQWDRLIERLGQIDNPVVPLSPSKSALRVNPTGTD